jgi:hypothetical protein
MADKVRKVSYCYVTVPSRVGQGKKILGALRDEGVNLLAYTGFPAGGKAQLDLVAEKLAPIRKVAKKKGWHLSKPKQGFLIQGTDKAGAVYRHVKKLADRKINVTAAEAVAAGKGRYGMLLWVKQKDFARAAKTLKAK